MVFISLQSSQLFLVNKKRFAYFVENPLKSIEIERMLFIYAPCIFDRSLDMV